MPTVLNIMLISLHKVMCVTYHSSYNNFFSQDMAFLPFTCASPVSPCRTLCLRRCWSVINAKSFTSKGRGPTIDMFPIKMLNSSGSSSSEVLRKNLPYLVSRFSSGKRLPFRSFAFVMVRNLSSLKIFSSPYCPPLNFFLLPGRSCTKNGLPFILIAPKIVRRSNSGESPIMAIKLKSIS